MAKHEIVMPQMGESITNGTITKWHKAPGDTIEIDEILLEISTDKVESEIPSPMAGRVEQVLYPEGETIDVGILIAVIEDDLSVEFGGGVAAPVPAKTEAAPAPAEATPAAPAAVVAAPVEEGRRFYTPLVKAMAAEAGIPLSELAAITGSGAGGRVNKADLENYMANRGSAPAAAPAARAAAPAPAVPSTPVFSSTDRVEVMPMDNMRKAIAKNMVASKLTSPHVNSIDEIDMTNLVNTRERIKKDFKAKNGVNLTYTHFIMYALVQALKEYPMVNASIDGDNIVLKKDINLGCAVAVPGNGLAVPVIKNADMLNLTGLALKTYELAMKTRDRKATMEDLSGGTFTFTNVGSFGTLMATPVILQPQLGIFASGVIKKRVMVMPDNSMAIRHMMYGTHTYDHRLVDGELGGLFLAHVKNTLETMDVEALL
jgi:2-oxoglutarate dehydrogenase E2 component (dihydrolipoamide succinyltransferase)